MARHANCFPFVMFVVLTMAYICQTIILVESSG